MCTTTFKNIVGIEIKDNDIKEHGVIMEIITEHGERCRLLLNYNALKYIRVSECPIIKLDEISVILQNRINEKRFFYGDK